MFKKIILAILLVCPALGQFTGFPIESNNTSWVYARTNQYMLQLFQAVEERCESLTNRVPMMQIVEDWPIQIGYSNQISTMMIGTTILWLTNRMPYSIVVETTNQCSNVILTTNMSWASSWFIPINTNIPISAISNSLSLPITHNFITTLDSAMLAITPYFADTNYASGTWGTNYNKWFQQQAFVALPYPGHWVYPQYYPMLCPGGVMTNAGIGYVTNMLYDLWRHQTNSDAYFTRQPLTTNAWSLWQAQIDRASVTISGAGWPYDGDYFQTTGENVNTLVNNFFIFSQDYVGGPWKVQIEYLIVGDICYQNTNNLVAIALSDIGYLLPPTFSGNPPIMFRLDTAAVIPSMEFNRIGTNTFVDPDWGTIHYYTGTLDQEHPSTTNGWRALQPWLGGRAGDPPSANPAIFSYSPSSNNLWQTRPLSSFDRRYYDVNPRPFYHVNLRGTNAISITVSNAGLAFVNFSDPDYAGNQVVEQVSEKITLTQTNTFSSYRWYSVSSSLVTGDITNLGSTVVLMWTNSHSYGSLPYHLEAKDLDERELYLKQLLWTTTPYWSWAHQTSDAISGTSTRYNIDTNYYTGYDYTLYNWWDPGGIIINDAYVDETRWLSDQPPTWGMMGPVGDWSAFFLTTYVLPWYTTYPNLSHGQVTNSLVPFATPPTVNLAYSTVLDRTENISFDPPYQGPYGPDGGLLVTNLATSEFDSTYGLLAFYETHPAFPEWWEVRGASSLDLPEEYILAQQVWSTLETWANVVTTNSDARHSHKDSFYIKTGLIFTNYVDSVVVTNTITETSGPVPPPTADMHPAVVFNGTPGGGYDLPGEEKIYWWAYPNGYYPVTMTNAISYTNTITFAPAVSVTNVMRVDYLHGILSRPDVFDGTIYYTNPTPAFVYQSVADVWEPAGKVYQEGHGYLNITIPPYSAGYSIPQITNYTGYSSTLYLSIPSNQTPLVIGQDCWTSVNTNVLTQTVVAAIAIYTNVDYWVAYAPIVLFAEGVHSTNDQLTYYSTSQYLITTNYYSTNVVSTNIQTIYLHWQPEAISNVVVAVRTNYYYQCYQSQSDSGTSNGVTVTIDPLMKWEVQGGYTRK